MTIEETSVDTLREQKACTRCGRVQPRSGFYSHPQTRDRLQSHCRDCNKAAVRDRYDRIGRHRPKTLKMFHAAKGRAAERGLPFTLTLEDVVIPPVCPVLGIPIGPTGSPYAPSLDRRDNTKGYTPENTVVVSRRANVLKSNGTHAEFLALARYTA